MVNTGNISINTCFVGGATPSHGACFDVSVSPFAQPAPESTEHEPKFCEYCGRQLYRNVKRSGKKETWTSFASRRFCSPKCAKKGLAAQRKKEKDDYRLERMRLRAELVREKKISEYVSLPKGFKEHPVYTGLFCNKMGQFWRNGSYKVVKFRKNVFGYEYGYVNFVCQGEKKSVLASRLVAATWKPDFDPDDFIEYIDGDIHNLALSNLHIVDYKSYYKQQAINRVENMHRADYQDQLDKIATAKQEILIMEDYFKTGEFTMLHDYVNNSLYKSLVDYCIHTLRFGRMRSQTEVANIIAYLYDYLLTGHAVLDITRFCKTRLRFIRNGHEEYILRLPRQIEMLITKHVNFDSLWDKYKVSSLKS